MNVHKLGLVCAWFPRPADSAGWPVGQGQQQKCWRGRGAPLKIGQHSLEVRPLPAALGPRKNQVPQKGEGRWAPGVLDLNGASWGAELRPRAPSRQGPRPGGTILSPIHQEDPQVRAVQGNSEGQSCGAEPAGSGLGREWGCGLCPPPPHGKHCPDHPLGSLSVPIQAPR